MITYLLDTNAIRSIRRSALQSARDAGHRLLLSPISMWELLSHMGDDNFSLAHANALKGQLCEVLDDPLAEMMNDVGCREAVNASRFHDRDAIIAVVRELETATTYQEMCERRVVVAGEVRLISDIAENIEKVFGLEKTRFKRDMLSRCRDYTERLGRKGAMQLGCEQFCREAVSLAHGLLEDTRVAECALSFAQIADRTILGAGYAVARAIAYIPNVPDIDTNDLEDYYICLHLSASSDRTFVTDDKNTYKAINSVIAAFTDIAQSTGKTFALQARVIKTKDFQNEISSVGREGTA